MIRPNALPAPAAGLALAASFGVYLIPLIGPHAAWCLGQMLWLGAGRQSLRWTMLNWAVALTAQLLAFGLCFWFLRKPGWRRGLALALLCLPAFPVLQWAYLAAIPAMFLEEPDVAAEQISWPAVCSVPGVDQTELKTRTELWVRDTQPESRYAVLAMPGCRLTPVDLPRPEFTPGQPVDFMIDVTTVGPGGRGVVAKHETRSGKDSWWLLPGMLPLDAPEGYAGRLPPILSDDARWVAWLEGRRVRIEPRDPGGQESSVDLSGLGPASFVLRRFDVRTQELILWKNDRLIAAGFDGRLKKEFPRPSLARPQANTYLEAASGWLAWDAYRESGRYTVEWSLQAGSGSHHVPLGRTIHSAAFDSSGRWIAVGVGTSLNIGSARDAVFVLRGADGREVFRKYLPRWNRSPVAFLEGGYFAYSDAAGVHVLRVPEAERTPIGAGPR